MILKLNPDDRVLFTVQRTEDVKNSYNAPEVKFVGVTATDANAAVHLSVASAQRQLARIGLTRATIVGRTVEFAATKKGAQKFLDINLPAGQLNFAPAANAPAAAPTGANTNKPTTETQKEALRVAMALYDQCFDRALRVSVSKLAAHQIAATHEGIATEAAALFQYLIAH